MYKIYISGDLYMQTDLFKETRRFLQNISSSVLASHSYICMYYIKNQQDATLAVLFISNCKITLLVSDASRTHDDGRGKRPKQVE
jgi:hypothetical protein